MTELMVAGLFGFSVWVLFAHLLVFVPAMMGLKRAHERFGVEMARGDIDGAEECLRTMKRCYARQFNVMLATLNPFAWFELIRRGYPK